MDDDQGEDPADLARDTPVTRWVQSWASRQLLIRVARRCGSSAEDAEDAVHEAMLRAAEHPDVAEDRLQAWLCSVTVRLCLDGHRRKAAEARRLGRASARAEIHQPGQGLEDEVCHRAEAAWIVSLAPELLPPRQVQALSLAAEGCTVQQIASHLGVRYGAAESLLARARRTLRTVLIRSRHAGLTMQAPG
jgi:RNA polymerase sigma factor (sigma-70 family)